jgi:hypothetical protein
VGGQESPHRNTVRRRSEGPCWRHREQHKWGLDAHTVRPGALVFLAALQILSNGTNLVRRAPIWCCGGSDYENCSKNTEIIAEHAFLSSTILVCEPVAGSITGRVRRSTLIPFGRLSTGLYRAAKMAVPRERRSRSRWDHWQWPSPPACAGADWLGGVRWPHRPRRSHLEWRAYCAPRRSPPCPLKPSARPAPLREPTDRQSRTEAQRAQDG